MRAEQPRLKRRRPREPAAPQRRRERTADQRERHRDRPRDRQPHPREQIVGERVASEALQDRERQQGDADEVVDVTGLTKRAGEHDPQQMEGDRRDEHQRRPMVNLSGEQPA